MGTRSAIGFKQADNTVWAIYCHWDGYPSHNGAILLDHYMSREKVSALMNLGNLSSLGPELGTKHDFRGDVKGECTAYGRDRGDPTENASLFLNKDEFAQAFDNWGVEYVYLFAFNQTEGYDWWMKDRTSPINSWKRLSGVLGRPMKRPGLAPAADPIQPMAPVDYSLPPTPIMSNMTEDTFQARQEPEPLQSGGGGDFGGGGASGSWDTSSNASDSSYSSSSDSSDSSSSD